MGGESAMHSLGRHFEWSSRIYFTAMVSFWWFYTLLLLTWSLWVDSRIDQQHYVPGQIPQTGMTPMKPSTLAMVVAGMHLMIFSWLLYHAWNAEDRMGVGIIAGTMLVLIIAAFFNTRSRTGADVGRTLGRHLVVAAGIILVLLILRADVWVASWYGVSVAEAHRLQPMWIVPVLSLALLIWGVVVAVALTKSKPRQPE